MSSNSNNQSLTKLVEKLIKLIEERWKSNLAVDLKLTIKRILRTLQYNCGSDPKEIAKRKVLIQQTYNLLIQRVGTGLVFDEAPSASSNQIHYLDFDPKRLINYQPNFIGGGTQSKPHHLIIGENYYALQNLIAAGYRNRVDIIYIDPPYNTKELQSYKDKFKRCGWLTMLKERLELADQLLAPNGIIFVSIDDAEQAYLKVLMDQIFKESNFITNFIWKSKTKTNDAKFISTVTEHILLYAKDKNQCQIARNYNLDHLSSYNKQDQFFTTRGGYKIQKLDNASHTYSPRLDYEFVYQNQKYYPGGCKKQWQKRQNGAHAVKDWQWMWSKQTLERGIKNHQVIFKKNNILTKRYQKVDIRLQPIKRSEPFTNLISDPAFYNTKGSAELIKIMNGKYFDHPKPVSLIKHLISLYPSSDNEIIILDFFAGTGTTAHAVLDLNRQDGGKRQFILCTNNEVEIGDLCYDRIHRIMIGKTVTGDTNFPWLKKHQPYGGGMNYYRVKTEDCGLNPATNNLNKFNFDQKSKKNLIQTFRKLNSEFKDHDDRTWINLLVRLTINSCADNKEIQK